MEIGMSKFKRRSVLLKKLVLDLAEAMRAEGLGCNAKAYREYGVAHSTFYKWKKAYLDRGIAGLERQKPISKSHPRQLCQEVIEKILHLRQKYHFGPQRITWYLEQYHAVKTSSSSVYRTLVRHGLRRLPRNVGLRAIHTKRYAKQVPGHHIQVDVTFLTLNNAEGKKIRRFQYTAIDDATRIRA